MIAAQLPKELGGWGIQKLINGNAIQTGAEERGLSISKRLCVFSGNQSITVVAVNEGNVAGLGGVKLEAFFKNTILKNGSIVGTAECIRIATSARTKVAVGEDIFLVDI